MPDDADPLSYAAQAIRALHDGALEQATELMARAENERLDLERRLAAAEQRAVYAEAIVRSVREAVRVQA